jgi:DNA gyrase subunit A
MQTRPIEEEIKNSYLEYAMSVIVSRAIPDVRDGLKPVQRRILYSMSELGVTYDKPYKKCARIVGETMGKYHPHGDLSIYDALARMAQTFSMRYTLIDGQGNFGSIDGDEPAAMRYTEARLARMSSEMVQDIEKNTVRFRQNFDGSLEEPEFFPTKVPQLLINGTSGIAVGMATNMLPNNLGEICDAITYKVDNPGAGTDDLLKFVKGPDFPGGGIVFYTKELVDSYQTGRGKALCHGEVDMEEPKHLIIKSLPFGVNKATFIESIATLTKNEVLKGVTDIRDESDRTGMRIVIKVRDDDMKPLVLNQLYENSSLETSIGITNLVLVNNEPRVLGLNQLIELFIEHRLEMILKRSKFDLAKNQERQEILLGIVKALDNIDRVVAAIRASKDVAAARASLVSSFEMSEKQADAILEMRLQRLTALETTKVKRDLDEVVKNIKRLSKIIDEEKERRLILKSEITELKEKFGDKRRTKVVYKLLKERSVEDLIPNEQNMVILSEGGLLKRVSIDEYKAQKRGGKGIITSTRKEDSVKSVLKCDSHDTIYYFTNTGRVIKGKVYELEKKNRKSVGTSGQAILPLMEGETVEQILNAPKNKKSFLILVTRKGFVKRTPAEDLFEMRTSGVRIITLEEDDEVVAVEHRDKPGKFVVVSSTGKVAVFHSREVRMTGRASRGVKSMKLKKNEYMVSAFAVEDDEFLFNVSRNGIGKRTLISEYPVHHRGSSGVFLSKWNDRTGSLVSALPVREADDILLVSKKEKTIRIRVADIRELSRVTAGVKLIDLDDEDYVISATRIEADENEE